MSALAKQLFAWNTEELKALNESTSIVRNIQSGEIYIKKQLDNVNINLAEKLCSIRHRNLAAVIEVTNENGVNYSYSEFAPGRSLQSYLDEGKTFTEKEAKTIILDVCNGLEILHANGIIHRDITASNVILSYDGNVKIIDYGIIRAKRENAECDTHILGTAGYAAPEQFGFFQTDERADIYSVGVLLNVLLTGKFPNEELCKGKSREIVKKCISMDLTDRYASVIEIKEQLSGKKALHRKVNNLPGFRSKSVLVRIAASIIYIAVLIIYAGLVFAIHSNIGTLKTILAAIVLALAFLIPYCFTFNPFNILENFKIYSKIKNSQQVFIRVFVSIIVFFGGFIGFLCFL